MARNNAVLTVMLMYFAAPAFSGEIPIPPTMA